MKGNQTLEGLLVPSGNLQNGFEESVAQILPCVGKAVSRLAGSAKLSIVIVPTVVDHRPEYGAQQPRGWSKGSTWNNADGMFCEYRREVLIAQGKHDCHGRLVESSRVKGVLLHELGHGIDFALGDFSLSTEFIRAYLGDVRHILGTAKEEKLSYYLQGFEFDAQCPAAGLSEAFAEVFAGLHGTTANKGETRFIMRSFPRSTKVVRRLLQTV